MTAAGTLRRRVGLGDAVVIGVGSMVGAGVFTTWAPAAAAAGPALLIGLLVAGVVAFCNATSSAQRRWRWAPACGRRRIATLGLVGRVTLVACLPSSAVLGGVTVLAVGVVLRLLTMGPVRRRAAGA